ncbi:hypothetical protein Q5P01_026403 [Channa striata]|uniref:Uncharacterized protein n=1 Tax=Channa striata TaxID=64152 RepID=A0AA88IJW9_CHASR|nr:hypothetical protein Q5P01_026403 [Channa striata]
MSSEVPLCILTQDGLSSHGCNWKSHPAITALVVGGLITKTLIKTLRLQIGEACALHVSRRHSRVKARLRLGKPWEIFPSFEPDYMS